MQATKKAVLQEVLGRQGGRQVKFGEVARQAGKTIDYRKEKIMRFVAGEHMETDNLKINQWGEIDEYTQLGSAFKVKFEVGQILYGSRRTYLRKVAVADFEGVCSNTTFVIASKDENILLTSYLAYLMQGETFTNFSILSSKGSTNPYINFSDLLYFEFTLPPLDRQAEYTALFRSFDARMQEARQARTCLQALKRGLIQEVIG